MGLKQRLKGRIDAFHQIRGPIISRRYGYSMVVISIVQSRCIGFDDEKIAAETGVDGLPIERNLY
jgi:hypothetical protein